MLKVGFISLLVVLSMGCSVIKIEGNRNYGPSDEIKAEKILQSIIKQNITTNNFFIKKAEIEISTQEGTEKGLGSLKFERPGKFLISLKSKTGIEAARIFISDDTILINDRISKKQYYGSAQYLKRKYGITASVLPVILGDFITGNLSDNGQNNCSDGKLDIDGILGGIKIKHVIDCKRRKSILFVTKNNLNDIGMEIKYSDFIKSGDVITPGKIEITDLQRMTKIEIRFKKIESPWSGNIEFIPGSRYEILELK